jgi:colicin import membrane protein
MNRLQKKCLVTAAGTHFLVVVVFFCSAFIRPAPKVDDSQVVEIIPSNILPTGETSGVKDAPPPPKAQETPMAKPPEPQHNTPPPAPRPQPQPQPVVKQVEPTPPPEPEKVTDPDMPSLELKKESKPKPHKIDVTLNPVKVKPQKVDNHKAEEEAKAEAEARAEADRAARHARDQKIKAFSTAATSILSGESSSTSVEIRGDSTASSASYSTVVKSIYTQRWILPDKVDNDDAIVKASVTISRDGKVIDAHIVGPSGDANVDRSVRQTLERVTQLPSFPEGMTDSQKTYIINFNLKAKREMLG